MKHLVALLVAVCALTCSITLYSISKNPVPEGSVVEEAQEIVKPNKGTSGFLSQVVIDLNNEMVDSNEEYQAKVDAAKEINEDVWGWISIPDFKIDYPVLLPEDNKEYLRTNINGRYDIAGSIYLDASYKGNETSVKLIHGHNMRNGKMFSKLPVMLRWETLDEAPVISIYDEYGLKNYKIFSVFSVNSKEEGVLVDVYSTLDELEALKQNYIERSWVPVKEVPAGTELLMLNTCWYGLQGNERNLHCIVVAVRV